MDIRTLSLAEYYNIVKKQCFYYNCVVPLTVIITFQLHMCGGGDNTLRYTQKHIPIEPITPL